jgi:tetraacyldisaccharide 4'-kinase
LTLILNILVQIRLRFYSYGWLNSTQLSVPVISVGNVTMGGTGKTPLCDYLLKCLHQLGATPAMVSRGYHSELKEVRAVDLSRPIAETARLFGDEPTLIALRNPELTVWVGAQRSLAGQRAIEGGANVLVLDDAFQHLRLLRDLNIVVLDASEPVSHLRLFPVGRAREPLTSLRRADLVVLSKKNLASSEQLLAIDEVIEACIKQGTINAPVIEVDYFIEGFRNLKTGMRANLHQWRGESAILVSAIGRPKSFEYAIEQCTSLNIASHLAFADHHAFTMKDVGSVLQECKQRAVDRVVITEKDSVKLCEFPELIESLWVAELGVKISKGKEVFDEALSRIFKTR